MTKVAVFIPTYRYGGIDVTVASLARQTYQPDLVLIADELRREQLWMQSLKDLDINEITFINATKKPGNKRNLCLSYNIAAESLDNSFDLFITLQDYIWLPPKGIERFVKIHEANPTELITGLTHISADPDPSEIYDSEGLYTIFHESYEDKPEKIAWTDVRSQMYEPGDYDILNCESGHWEANWAATPVTKFRQGIFWDEDYDQGIAYENVDFAEHCVSETGCRVLLDLRNQAISLPHKDYFEGEREEIIQYSNRWLYESKWAV